MIKGVNRQVLEIHDTGIDCFEKAIFFVKPEYSTISDNKLHEKALRALGSSTKVPKTKHARAKMIILRSLYLLSAAGVGAAITMLIK